MATGLINWSQTAATNATADSAVNWAEGMAPSAVNDSARAMMASVAKWRDDISGAIVTSGSSTAYTVTSYQGYALTAGFMVAFNPHATNGATVTLNVDSLGAKPLRSAPGVELPAGVLVLGTPYTATYFASNSGEWILNDFYGNPYNIPLGGLLPYTGSTAPNSSFVLPYGQAISRTTYATYFTLVGTTYGVGDGTTTFNVIDVRGRSLFGKDDMGGSAASRVTTAGSSVDGTTIGAVGGGQTVTVAQANLPSVNFTVSGITLTNGSFAIPVFSGAGGDGATGIKGSNTGNNTSAGAATSNVSVATQGVAASGGSGTALANMPPAIIVPFILRIL